VTGCLRMRLSSPPSARIFIQKIKKIPNISGSEGKLTPMPIPVLAKLIEKGFTNTARYISRSKRKIAAIASISKKGIANATIYPLTYPKAEKDASRIVKI
jgi:hypothetical protein